MTTLVLLLSGPVWMWKPVSLLNYRYCELELSADANIMNPSLVKPFDAHCCHMGTAIKHPVPDRIKPVICNFWYARISKITNDGLSNSVWHRMLIAVPIWQQWASSGLPHYSTQWGLMPTLLWHHLQLTCFRHVRYRDDVVISSWWHEPILYPFTLQQWFLNTFQQQQQQCFGEFCRVCITFM